MTFICFRVVETTSQVRIREEWSIRSTARVPNSLAAQSLDKMGLTFLIVQSMLLEQTLWQASSVFSTFNSILRMMVPNDSIDQEFTLYTNGE